VNSVDVQVARRRLGTSFENSIGLIANMCQVEFMAMKRCGYQTWTIPNGGVFAPSDVERALT
jgi:hypothetical protein